jgi:hypothetical protein
MSDNVTPRRMTKLIPEIPEKWRDQVLRLAAGYGVHLDGTNPVFRAALYKAACELIMATVPDEEADRMLATLAEDDAPKPEPAKRGRKSA